MPRLLARVRQDKLQITVGCLRHCNYNPIGGFGIEAHSCRSTGVNTASIMTRIMYNVEHIDHLLQQLVIVVDANHSSQQLIMLKHSSCATHILDHS